jgi:hypothetical protein
MSGEESARIARGSGDDRLGGSETGPLVPHLGVEPEQGISTAIVQPIYGEPRGVRTEPTLPLGRHPRYRNSSMSASSAEEPGQSFS